MRRLILMRHAKSDWSFAGLDDHARPLNKRGRTSAQALGNWLRTNDYLPDEIICSSAQRTGETLLGLGLDPATPTRFTRALYHAGAEAMHEVLQTATGDCVLMLGHNPGICDFAHRLVSARPAHDRFFYYPTGATLVCDFDAYSWNDIGWRKGQPIDFIIPRELT